MAADSKVLVSAGLKAAVFAEAVSELAAEVEAVVDSNSSTLAWGAGSISNISTFYVPVAY